MHDTPRAVLSYSSQLNAGFAKVFMVAVLGGFLGVGVHEFGLFVLRFAGWAVSVGVALLQPASPDQLA